MVPCEHQEIFSSVIFASLFPSFCLFVIMHCLSFQALCDGNHIFSSVPSMKQGLPQKLVFTIAFKIPAIKLMLYWTRVAI